MRVKGDTYELGSVMGGNWRPDYDPKIVRRELEIIKNDLICNAVRICGQNIGRLVSAATEALHLDLEVWLSLLRPHTRCSRQDTLQAQSAAEDGFVRDT